MCRFSEALRSRKPFHRLDLVAVLVDLSLTSNRPSPTALSRILHANDIDALSIQLGRILIVDFVGEQGYMLDSLHIARREDVRVEWCEVHEHDIAPHALEAAPSFAVGVIQALIVVLGERRPEEGKEVQEEEGVRLCLHGHGVTLDQSGTSRDTRSRLLCEQDAVRLNIRGLGAVENEFARDTRNSR